MKEKQRRELEIHEKVYFCNPVGNLEIRGLKATTSGPCPSSSHRSLCLPNLPHFDSVLAMARRLSNPSYSNRTVDLTDLSLSVATSLSQRTTAY